MGLTGSYARTVETGCNGARGTRMKFVLDTLMIFFATLAVAALVALGEPVDTVSVASPAPAAQTPVASR
jgi:hypothetical protein